MKQKIFQEKTMRQSLIGEGSCDEVPDDVKKLLSDSKNRQVLSLFQKSLLLSKLTAGLTFFFHVFCKFLFSSNRQRATKIKRSG